MTNDSHITITVLLIEDSEADAGLIKAHLDGRSNPSFAVQHETTLHDGVKRLHENLVDIVVLDLSLPDSNGLETFSQVTEAANGAPIVVLSGVKDDQIALEAVRLGAQDFFSKNETISESLGRSLQYTIERFHRQRVEREIDAAAFIQRRLYPRPLPPLPGLDVAGRCDPANQVGGDYFDYLMADENSLILLIGDVSGHGFGPSLVMAETRAAFRTLATTTDDIGKMIRLVNALLVDDNFGTFVSLFLARIDVTTGVCRYVSAGQPAELVRADGSTETLECGDPPLGIRLRNQFTVRQTQLQPNDTLLLYTDGISERSSATPTLFGVSRMRQLIVESSGLTAAQTLERLFDEANAFSNARPPADDMTAIVLKVNAIASNS
ncbi:MAG: fused response regulator/phosphatase [Planctomycetia bacterium]|nr:fused response regulator/phosphatase [Planctomycetia bacterium]